MAAVRGKVICAAFPDMAPIQDTLIEAYKKPQKKKKDDDVEVDEDLVFVLENLMTDECNGQEAKRMRGEFRRKQMTALRRKRDALRKEKNAEIKDRNAAARKTKALLQATKAGRKFGRKQQKKNAGKAVPPPLPVDDPTSVPPLPKLEEPRPTKNRRPTVGGKGEWTVLDRAHG